MRIVGLTGGIACGKSTVARLLAEEHGLPVVDCDELARAAVARGTWGWRRVRAAFGDVVLTPEGEIDRRARARLRASVTGGSCRRPAARALGGRGDAAAAGTAAAAARCSSLPSLRPCPNYFPLFPA
jgi:hypothetical protein